MTLRAASADWVPRLALRLGGELRVVTPPELAEEVRRRAAEALAALRRSLSERLIPGSRVVGADACRSVSEMRRQVTDSAQLVALS